MPTTIHELKRIKFTDIRFWIFVFFIIRLIGITNPPLEIGHNWRQSLTNMIARNFLESDPNIFYPRIDMAGNDTGIIGSEFPFFNYLIYIMSRIFGYSHWYGRLINLIVSSLGIYAFNRLVEKISSKKIAFNASIVLLSSIWFAFSRKIMPDTFSVSLTIIGLYFCYTYLSSGSLSNLFQYFLFITIGMLCKIPALCLISATTIIVFFKEIPNDKKINVFLATIASVIVVSLWYFYWVPFLLNKYHYQLYYPKGLIEGIKEIKPLFPDFLKKFYYDSLSSYIALPFLLSGVYFIFKENNFYLKTGILVITFSFFIFILKTGAVFPTHNYYIIPFTPVMAFIVGYGISIMPSKYVYAVLILISLEGILNQQHDFFIKDSEMYKTSLEDITNRNSNKTELIVINGGQSPQEIYFAHRKGWTISNKMINKKELDLLKLLGASRLIVDRNSFKEKIDYYPVIYSDINFNIYKLK